MRLGDGVVAVSAALLASSAREDNVAPGGEGSFITHGEPHGRTTALFQGATDARTRYTATGYLAPLRSSKVEPKEKFKPRL